MAKRSRGSSDDLRLLQLIDFAGGLNSMHGAFSLPLNECQIEFTWNVIGFPGRALYVGGFSRNSTMPSNGVDGACEFYDSTGTAHQMEWVDGNLYETTSGAYVLIEAGIYTPGDPVGHVDQAGILYHISPNMPLRMFDGTTASAVPGNAPQGGTYMTAFAGSLIVANYKSNLGVYQPSSFVPSGVNTPTNWLYANAQTVGTDYNGIISFIIPMGISSTGIPPSKSMVVGKTAGNLFLYRGAIGQQEEAIVNCPVGCLDALSAVYVPAPTLFGQVIFLGTDNQLWGCDGVIAEPLTQDKNLTYVYSLISNSLAFNANQRFSAMYDNRFSYYLLDIGNNKQLIWMWKTKSLFQVNGWPSGIYFNGHDNNGLPANFVAAKQPYAPGVYQVGQDFTDFNGVNPTIAYQTAYIHGGNAELTKDFLWAALLTRNVGAQYKIIGTSMRRSDDTVLTTNPLYVNDPSIAGAAVGVWDVSNWDEADWGADANLADPVISHGMLSVPVPAGPWVPPGVTQPLRSGAASFTISWNPIAGLPPAFDVIGFQVRYMPRSMRTSGSNKYIAEGAVPPAGINPWVGDIFQ